MAFSILRHAGKAFSGLASIKRDPYRYTEEEHIQRISKRVEKRFPDYGAFSVYPLFDEQEKFTHFIVEFDSGRFILIMLCYSSIMPAPRISNSIYQLMYNDYPWQRFTFKTDEDISPRLEESRNYETDDNGNFIYRYTSPFHEAGIKNEKRYFLEDGIFAVKRGDKFFNLVSMDYIRPNEAQPTIGIGYLYFDKL